MYLRPLILLQAGSLQHVRELRVDENEIRWYWFSLQFEDGSARSRFCSPYLASVLNINLPVLRESAG
jgi:hypothetical protein